MKRFFAALTLVLGLSVMAVAAEDATGNWKATLETPNGSVVSTFVFKVDGDKLTGSVATEGMGVQQITNGKVDGDKISFSFSAEFGTIAYTGTVKGDEIAITINVGDGMFTLNTTATRVKT
jgi:hypothetical protein